MLSGLLHTKSVGPIYVLRFPPYKQRRSYTCSQVSSIQKVSVLYMFSGFLHTNSVGPIHVLRSPPYKKCRSYTCSQVSSIQKVSVLYMFSGLLHTKVSVLYMFPGLMQYKITSTELKLCHQILNTKLHVFFPVFVAIIDFVYFVYQFDRMSLFKMADEPVTSNASISHCMMIRPHGELVHITGSAAVQRNQLSTFHTRWCRALIKSLLWAHTKPQKKNQKIDQWN